MFWAAKALRKAVLEHVQGSHRWFSVQMGPIVEQGLG